MILFKTIAELQATIRVDQTFKLESLAPFETDAIEKYIIPFTGSELWGVLKTGYIDDTLTTELTALLPYVQRVDGRFSFVHASPSLNIKIGEIGYTTNNSQNQVVASKDRTDKLNDSIEQLGWDAIESMLKFLEDNVDDYPEWESSTAYTMATRNLINSALEYQKKVDINESRLMFKKLRIHLDYVEKEYIIPVISQEMFDDIIDELRDGTLSANYLTIIENLRYADAYLSSMEYKFNEQQKLRGNAFLLKVQKSLYADPDNFPIWKASDSYNEDHDTFQQHDNSDTDTPKLFVMGAADNK